MRFDDETLEKLAEAAWVDLAESSEARYVLDEDEDPYKPFYRMAVNLVQYDPPQWKLLGLQEHLTEEEALEIAKRSHPYMRRKLEERDEHFLVMFRDFRDMYDPAEDWKEKSALRRAVRQLQEWSRES